MCGDFSSGAKMQELKKNTVEMMDFLIVKLWLFELSPYTHVFECLVLSKTVSEGLEGVSFWGSCVTREWALSFQKLRPGPVCLLLCIT